MHDDAYIGGHSENNIKCVVHDDLVWKNLRTEQLDIFCRVTGFTNDYLSFIVVELIRFFHGAPHFLSNAIKVRFAS